MKYVPGPQVGQLSGSQGNTTASRNKWGSYLRNRVQPVNPNTPAQAAARLAIEQLSTAYRGLSNPQREDWSALGDQIVRQNSLGQTYTLSGLQAFTSVNRVRQLFGQSVVTSAPALLDTGVLTSLTLTANTTPVLSAAFLPTPIGAALRLLVEATPPMSGGINFVPRSMYRLLAATALDVASPLNLLSAWQARFGTFAVGQRIFCRVRVVNASFIAGPALPATTLVVLPT
jgi:hypothetical protein